MTLLDRYGSQIRLVFKDYPLPNHENAFKAAEAGNCANEQGKFWQFHDKLFRSQGALGTPALKAYAGELGLDEAAFASCLDSGRFAAEVQRDLAIGRSYGVSATPAFFVNGRAVVGAVPLDVFDQIVREEIAAAER
jgi:protein-disulfide isomerase